MDDDAATLAAEFSQLVRLDKAKSASARLTPHICREGCKHYDPVKDMKNEEIKEFCWFESKGVRISGDGRCNNFQSRVSAAPEGVLSF